VNSLNDVALQIYTGLLINYANKDREPFEEVLYKQVCDLMRKNARFLELLLEQSIVEQEGKLYGT
jgi:hypothetical protein